MNYLFTPSAITYGNGLYVVVGSTNNVASIMTSPDGTTWTYRKAGISPGGPINGLAYGNRRFVAIGNNDGNVYASGPLNAGTSWTQYAILGGSGISSANGLFFVPVNNNSNLLSTDGINWSLTATGLTNMLGAVTYGNGIFMAQCGISAAGSYFATSTDGTNWFQYAMALPNYCGIFDTSDFDSSLATDGTRLVSVGSSDHNSGFFFNGFIYTSDVLAGIRLTNSPAANVALSGLVGRNYQIQSADMLTAGANIWRTNASLQLTNTPIVWTDATATNSARFYRGVLLP